MLPVEPTRGPRLPGQAPTGAPPCGGVGQVSAQNRRMNAVKSNHPKDMIGGPGPKMGKNRTCALIFKYLQLVYVSRLFHF